MYEFDKYEFDKYEINKRWWYLDYLFDKYRWYRKLCGDHWELWYIDATRSHIWHNRMACYKEVGAVICGRGEPICEDY